jgi:hypothetical protein
MTAAFDYAALKAAVPDVLLPQFGVAVTLTRAARGTGLKSWEQDQGPAASTAAQSIATSGVQVALDKDEIALQTIETRLGKWALTAETLLPEEVGPEWSLVANGITYPIFSVKPVQPGDTLLLYFVMVTL